MKVLLMVISAFAVPTIGFAGIASLISSTFGPGGPCFPVTLLVACAVGRQLFKQILTITGGNGSNIDLVTRCFEVGIVISAVYGLLNTAFNLLGL